MFRWAAQGIFNLYPNRRLERPLSRQVLRLVNGVAGFDQNINFNILMRMGMGIGVFTAWSLATLVVPICLPFAVLFCVQKVFEIRREDHVYRSAVSDGQLFWLAISLSAAAAFDAGQSVKADGLSGVLGLVWFLFLIGVAVFFIAMWTVGSLNGVKHVESSSAAPQLGGSSPPSKAVAQSDVNAGGIAMKERALIKASWICLGVTASSYAIFKSLG